MILLLLSLVCALCATPAVGDALQQLRAAATILDITPAQWAALNSSVGGRLATARPYAAPCYKTYNGKPNKQYNPNKCKAAQAGKDDSTYLSSQPNTFFISTWAGCPVTGASCTLTSGSNQQPIPIGGDCEQGSVARYYIKVASPADIQAGFAFARQYNLPVVVKNTGHDYKGRSSAPNALVLWTGSYQPQIYATKGFTPVGCPGAVGDVITFGAGQGVYEFADANGYTVVGGSSKTVGVAGGWVTGGGHSPLSVTMGLGSDNVQQITAVLPNGTIVTASRCQNQDLFFALRGGGGGTFGVITQMSTLAHPPVTLQFAVFGFLTLNQFSLRQLLTILVANANKWADEGWGGFFGSGKTDNQFGITLMTPLLSKSDARASMAPLFDFSNSILHPGSASINSFSSWYGMFHANFEKDNLDDNLAGALASRLIPRATFSSNPSQLVDALMSIITNSSTAPGTIGSLAVNVVGPNPKFFKYDNSAAVTPAWYNSTWHVAAAASTANGPSPAAALHAFRFASNSIDRLRAMTPYSGAYINEADTFEPDAPGAFWGQQNYQRLLGIKAQVDPQNLLSCHQCVGWNPSDPRFACYPPMSAV